MKYFVIAGEASGDLHGGHLLRELKAADEQAQFVFCGGIRMQNATGTAPLIHYQEMAVMGLIEVLMNLRKIAGFLSTCKTKIRAWQPDVLILIDYPGFNLRMAELASKSGIPVFYYISPKIWAWKKRRIQKIKQYVSRMFVIFPFEKDFYANHNFEVEFHGNPLLDEIEQQKHHFRNAGQFRKNNGLDEKPIIALLAGSRRQELKYNLPLMLAMEKCFPEYQFVTAGAPGLEKQDYAPYLKHSHCALLFNQTYEILYHARAALVTSGTATLEAALLNTPQVVCYSMFGGRLATWVKKNILRIGFISLINIILQRAAITELFQEQMHIKRLYSELRRVADDTPERSGLLEDYATLREMLGHAGTSRRVAQRMTQLLQS